MFIHEYGRKDDPPFLLLAPMMETVIKKALK